MIKENKLNAGDRVQSTIAGYYKGVPATVIKLTETAEPAQGNDIKTYDIQLDTGEVLTMSTNQLERVKGANK